MPRQPRFILPGVAMHVIQRGHNRNACFRETSDYFVYLMHLRELAGGLGCAVHAYCLMTNHVHLLVTPPTPDACTRLMRNLGQRYAQYFNRHHHRSGALWEGRFRSCVTESARYVLGCYRYIEMNPVRAGMASAPGDYRWSSHAGNVGARTDGLITPHAEFLALAESGESRRTAYLALFQPEMQTDLDEIRIATNGGYPLVSERFKATLAVDARRLAPRKSGPKPAG